MTAMESLETLVAHIRALELVQLQSLLKKSDEALRSQTCRHSCLSSTPPSTPSDSSYLFNSHMSSSITRELVGDFLPSISEFLNACSAYQICLESDRHDTTLLRS